MSRARFVIACAFANACVTTQPADELIEIVRLPVKAFPRLPPEIVAVLNSRACTIPQPYPHDRSRNVIQGEFFEHGVKAWAIVCSSGETSTILVFRHAGDQTPHELGSFADRESVSKKDDTFSYCREIAAVGREEILRHRESLGVPPIDHQGIDDVFLEKFSRTFYFHEGKWLPLQGAD